MLTPPSASQHFFHISFIPQGHPVQASVSYEFGQWEIYISKITKPVNGRGRTWNQDDSSTYIPLFPSLQEELSPCPNWVTALQTFFQTSEMPHFVTVSFWYLSNLWSMEEHVDVSLCHAHISKRSPKTSTQWNWTINFCCKNEKKCPSWSFFSFLFFLCLFLPFLYWSLCRFCFPEILEYPESDLPGLLFVNSHFQVPFPADPLGTCDHQSSALGRDDLIGSNFYLKE